MINYPCSARVTFLPSSVVSPDLRGPSSLSTVPIKCLRWSSIGNIGVDASASKQALRSPPLHGMLRKADDDGHGNGTSSPRKRRNVTREQGLMETISNYNQEVVNEGDLYLEGIGFVRAILLSDCLTWHLAEVDDELIGNSCWGQRDTEKTLGQVPLSEVYASEMCEMSSLTPARCCGSCCSELLPQMYRFAVHTFQRSQNKKCNWIPKVYTFCHESADICQAWVAHIQGLLDRDDHRPKSLLVLVNPYGGKGSGVQEWESVAPMFERARVRTKVILTERAGHAHDLMANASEEDLRTLDGVVVVGGDGLFNEVLNGLLMKRHNGPAAPKPQLVSEMLAKASRAEDKPGNDSTKGQEGFHLQGIGVMKNDPLGSSYDVSCPLLKRLPYPEIDVSRSISSSSTSSSSNATPERPSTSDSTQQQDVYTVPTDLASKKEIELSEFDSVDLSHPGTSPKTGIKREGQQLIPVTIQDISKSSDGEGLSSLASTGRPQNLGMKSVQLRIGIIPAGSTDTVAVSTTGSRDPITAALHIILGDNMPLDVVRLTGWKKSPQSGDEPPTVRYAASFAGYGFYGDVMKESETTRWMGPARYDVAGFKVFMKHKKYMAEVSFLEMPTNSTGKATHSQRKVICRANCFVCSQGIDWNHLVSEDDEAPSQRLPKPKWRTIQDSFHSVGAAVMSCRNDKAPDGLVAHAHLSDGLLDLILIKSCSRPNYLRQLITLTRRGADPLDFDFVEHYKTPVFTFTSHGKESVWNVDGELFPAHQLSGQCFRGLVNVFARGPEY
ncbi:unnamed protein product [Calypogeia fissa]